MRRFETVIFDCDSTLCAVEGIDELAGEEHRQHIAELTEAAMAGRVPLEQVYGERLALIAPTAAQVQRLGERYTSTIVPGAPETIAALRSAGVRVRIISGGLRPPVERLAAELGVAAADVAAVEIYFDEQGHYAGFDAASPLTRSHGKYEVISDWRRELPAPMMLVGDGMTDLEAKPTVEAFVAFAGVVARERVLAQADAVIRGQSLTPLLELVLPTSRSAPDLRERPAPGRFVPGTDPFGSP